MKKILWLLLLFANTAWAQHCLTGIVRDSASHETLPGVTIQIKNTTTGTATDANGKFVLKNISGEQTLVFSYTGYKAKEVNVSPGTDKVITVNLTATQQEIEEVVVSSTRTNSRIEDLPMKVEVLGQEEMDEENQLKPGNVASILGDLSVIHVQQTSAVTGNTTIRMQGLDGRYTQLRRDGLPLFDGFSGNFGVLSIPPLDLKQIEIIKGSSSTLYGGGAIAGLINFISKTPSPERDLSFTLNRSSLKENNFNGYFSQRFDKVGFTFLAQQTIQGAADVNKDGFSDVAKVNSTLVHPRFFYYPNSRSQFDAGYAFTYEDRTGGDMQVIDGHADNIHQYIEQNLSYRNTFDFHYQNGLDSVNHLTVKGSASNYRLHSNDDGFHFNGNQLLDYVEVSDLINAKANDIVLGANYTGEYFRKQPSDPTPLTDYTYHTLGAFVQDGWHVTKQFLIEAGLRTDHHNEYGWFVLPRLALLYKPVQALSIRLSSGLGYKAPNIFTPETLSGNYSNLLPVTSSLSSERSLGVNFDANYHIKLGDKASMDIDQALYYSRINNPLIPIFNADNTVSLSNAAYRINSAGTDTYVRLLVDDFEIYFGYNHTIAKEAMTGKTIYLPFSPQNKISATVAYEIEGKWRMGLEGSFETKQYINENQRVRNTPFAAAMIERKFGKHFSLVANCENLTDFRQSRYEQLYTGTVTHPVFTQLWGPIDGRIVNLALRIKI